MLNRVNVLAFAQGVITSGLLATAASTPAFAAQACEVSSDAGLYQQRREQAIILMQYGDIVLRATGGKIRCQEDQASARQVCQVDGPGEMLIDAATGQFVVRMTGSKPHAVHVYASGDISCGLAADMK